MSKTQLTAIALLVHDYDEAVSWFCECLDFELREDTPLGDGGKRWVVVGPKAGGAGLVLAKAKNTAERAAVGRQAPDRVWLFYDTDNFADEYERLRGRGVTFIETPRSEVYGQVVVFEDLYGNRWDLRQPAHR
ncbi:MAG: VOC family protein [Pseudomonadota bacterium]